MPSLWPFGRSTADYFQVAGHLESTQTADSIPHAIIRTLTRRATSSRIDPTHDQRTIIIVACVYVVVIAALWNIPYLKLIIYPFKLNTVGLHEFSHAIVGLITGAKIESITLEPNEGGATRMRGGIAWLTLPAGYLGSSFVGAAMIACAFDIRASKVMTLILAAIFLLTLWWARRDWLVWVLLFVMAGIIVAFWFIAHGVALQYYVLFMGVMSCLYSIWDIIEDLVLYKHNDSDASAFSRLVGGPPQMWGVLWAFISVGFFALGMIVGILAFKDTIQQQQSDNFLNTRSEYVLLRPR